MKNYVIIDADAIQKRIEELEKNEDDEFFDEQRINHLLGQINALQYALSQSTPLIPEIEKAVTEGVNSIHFENDGSHWRDENVVEDYISNLKLDI